MFKVALFVVILILIVCIMSFGKTAKESLTNAELVTLRTKYRNAIVGLSPSPDGYNAFKSRIGVTSFSPLGFTQMATANKKGTLTDALIDRIINR